MGNWAMEVDVTGKTATENVRAFGSRSWGEPSDMGSGSHLVEMIELAEPSRNLPPLFVERQHWQFISAAGYSEDAPRRSNLESLVHQRATVNNGFAIIRITTHQILAGIVADSPPCPHCDQPPHGGDPAPHLLPRPALRQYPFFTVKQNGG